MDLHDLQEATIKYYLSEFTDSSYNSYLLTEAKRGYSYYEFRVLLTMLFKYASDQQTKNVLKNLIKTTTQLEMLNVPMPVIPRIGSSELRKFLPTVKNTGRTKKR
jgi:hypothetical protein